MAQSSVGKPFELVRSLSSILSLTKGMKYPLVLLEPAAKQTLLVLVASTPAVFEKELQHAPADLHSESSWQIARFGINPLSAISSFDYYFSSPYTSFFALPPPPDPPSP